MTTVVGIRFKDSGKTYYFDPSGLDLQQGDAVIVDTTRGPEMARVAYGHLDVDASEIVGELRPVLRRAEEADFQRIRSLQTRHDDVMARCAEKIKDHALPMKLVKAEYSFDGSRLTFYFTSEQRVDFRMLVRDLARTFRSRIELRQIGPRDEAKLLGSIGPCGRLLCCSTFLPDYARVSIKMAKDQDLPLNPSKISGVCGRLLCCLSYEHQQYLDMKAALPSRGDWVQTPDGPGDVVAVNVLREAVTVRLASSGMEEDYTVAQIEKAARDVQATARSRASAGIAPTAADPAEFDRPDSAEEQELLYLLEGEDLEALEGQQRRQERSRASGQPERRARERRQPQRPPASDQPPVEPQEGAPPSGKSRSRRSAQRRKAAAAKSQAEQPPQTSPTSQPGPTSPTSRAGKSAPRPAPKNPQSSSPAPPTDAAKDAPRKPRRRRKPREE